MPNAQQALKRARHGGQERKLAKFVDKGLRVERAGGRKGESSVGALHAVAWCVRVRGMAMTGDCMGVITRQRGALGLQPASGRRRSAGRCSGVPER